MPLSRTETRSYIRGLYRFLENGSRINFRKMKQLRGYIHIEDEKGYSPEVYLDHRQEVISTLLHEYLHYRHPKWCETDILRYESLLVNSLSDRQIRNIFKKFAAAL